MPAHQQKARREAGLRVHFKEARRSEVIVHARTHDVRPKINTVRKYSAWE
jgi:hypothetical protein